MDEIMVSVSCLAYNHEKYIRQCMDSLVNQKVNFKYEILVHDDASTDKTQQIIKEYEEKYPEMIRPIYQTVNQFSQQKQVGDLNLKRARGKYITFCEGDDFWTSQDKLQKQVDFLETHQEYVLCAHAAYYAQEDGTIDPKRIFAYSDYECDVPVADIISKWCFATNSLMYRQTVRNPLVVPYRGKCKNGDYALVTFLAFQGNVYYMNDLLSAYRVNSIGSLNNQWKRNPELRKKDRMEYINMVYRMDEYTNKKYHKIIEQYARKIEFEMYCQLGDMHGMKKFEDLYRQLSFKKKMKLFLGNKLPYAYEKLKIILKK